MKNISDKYVEKITTHIFYSVTFFFFENLAIYEIRWEKYCRAGQNTDGHMAHVHCMLHN